MMADNPSRKTRTRFFSNLATILNGNKHASKLFILIMRNPLYRGVAILGSGTAIAQLIGIFTTPIITRLYTPSDMGILAVYSSVLAIVGIGATLRYEFAFPLPKKDEDAINLFGLSLVILCITTIGFGLVLLFGKDLLLNTFNLAIIGRYAWLLPIGFFGMGFYTILSYWAVRQRDYKRITYTKINQGVGGSITKILLGILAFGPIGLIIGHVISQMAGISTLAREMWNKERVKLNSISLNRMKDVGIKYKSFPKFNLPASIVNTLSTQLPAIALLALYDSEVVGFYALAYMLVVLPGSLISSSMGQAYLGEASKMVRDRSLELRSLYTTTLKHLALVGVPLIGITALLAPFIVPFIFGGAWVEAGVYCLPLALMMIPQFIASPTSKLTIYGYNHWMLALDVARGSLIIVGFAISQMLGLPPLVTLTIYSLIMLSMYIMLIQLNLWAISRFTRLVQSKPPEI